MFLEVVPSALEKDDFLLAYRLAIAPSTDFRIIQSSCVAAYPPYHSKYNPVERAFGWLEQHWRGSLLDSVDTILRFASTLSFKGKNPVVTLVEKIYHTGVKLTQQAMNQIEEQISRLPTLKKWFVEIFCRSD